MPQPHLGRSRTLLAATLMPVVAALLACSGLAGSAEDLSDTGDDPLVLDVAGHRGSGDGATSEAPARRPSVQEKLAGFQGPARSTTAPDDDPSAPTPGPAKPESIRGVKQTGDTSWTVKQRVATRWENNPYDLANVESHGDGWMLKRVRKGDAHYLGMKNKDIILSINGRKLKTQAQLLAAYLALKNKKDFEVVFLRNGKQRKHHYRIVD